jgi:hypothetical protein
MIKYRLGTRWSNDREVRWRCVRSAPCTRRQGARIFLFSFKTSVDGFFQFGFKINGYGSCGLASKSLSQVFQFEPQNRQLRFGNLAHKMIVMVFCLCFKIKWHMVCRLHHKIDGRMKTVWDTRRALVACFAWKWVRLGFPSLDSRLAEAWCIWCMWHHRRGRTEMKPKTDMLVQLAASHSSTPTLPFSLY